MADKNGPNLTAGKMVPATDCSNALTYQAKPLWGKMIDAQPSAPKAFLAQYDDIFLNSKFFECRDVTCSLLKAGCAEAYPANGKIRMEKVFPFKIFAYELGTNWRENVCIQCQSDRQGSQIIQHDNWLASQCANDGVDHFIIVKNGQYYNRSMCISFNDRVATD